MPVTYMGSAMEPGPLFGLTMATTGTLGCAVFAAMRAAHDGSVGYVYKGTIVPLVNGAASAGGAASIVFASGGPSPSIEAASSAAIVPSIAASPLEEPPPHAAIGAAQAK